MYKALHKADSSNNHRKTYSTILASHIVASSRARQVQSGHADIQGSPQHCTALPCHSSMLQSYPVGNALRSAVTDRLAVPSVRSHTVGNRAFQVAARRSGTVYQITPCLLHPSLPSAAYYKLFYLVFHSLI